MRVLRDNIYRSILQAARNEFVKRGFKDASLRVIAKNAGVGLSNIYNYFRSKDEIFLTIVTPAKDSIFEFVTEKHTEKYIDFSFMSTLDYQEETVEVYIQLLEKYKEELRLLLFHSQGSSVENFRESFTEYLTDISHNHMLIVKKHYPQVKEVSPFFTHALCAFMVSIVGEIITHNLDKQKIREFFREYFRFEIAGWRELIGL
ncbi:AcrR family transcriptional regulator [Dysgonomonas hofstadii]|uniref:AcrR family transcriptional regulator n=1 Tax=Dysgonomonas hofstadii TaxID=637886 RepID=A0A840CRU3_9BACT|nr:TetR/AcrR family transcriptional regulator [Dysgonomonas hofstadii]MBB4035645.1 AcrR family transcriptional regulator [Dysgonomonas hofstadii]